MPVSIQSVLGRKKDASVNTNSETKRENNMTTVPLTGGKNNIINTTADAYTDSEKTRVFLKIEMALFLIGTIKLELKLSYH